MIVRWFKKLISGHIVGLFLKRGIFVNIIQINCGFCEFECFRDLAVDLRLKLGDWFRVVQLLKTGGGGGKYIRGYDRRLFMAASKSQP